MMEFDGTIVFQMVNFLVLLVLLNHLLFRPVFAAIEERRSFFTGSQAKINEAMAQLDKARTEYEAQLGGARQEGQALVARVAAEAAATRQRRLAEVASEHATRLEEAKGQLARDREAALQEVRQGIDTLGTLIVEKLLAPTSPALAAGKEH